MVCKNDKWWTVTVSDMKQFYKGMCGKCKVRPKSVWADAEKLEWNMLRGVSGRSKIVAKLRDAGDAIEPAGGRPE